MERKNKNKFPFQSVVHAISPSHLIAFSQKDFPGDASGKEPDCQCRRCKRYRECASLVAQLVKNLPAMQETLVQFLSWEVHLEKGQATNSSFLGFPGRSDGKESSVMRETWVQSPGWEDPLQEGTATHCSILAWRI